MPSQLEGLLRPLVTGWEAVIERAKKHKKELFGDAAEECELFFSGKNGFMWDPKYRHKFFEGSDQPKFRMTMNKAFELVAIFGPLLYHRNPFRQVRPRKALDIPMELVIGDMAPLQMQMQQMQMQMQQMQPDPNMPPPPQAQQLQMQMQQVQQQMQQMQMQAQQFQIQQAQGQREDDTRAMLMETYLNYTPNEMPGGGLKSHAEMAITDALVKGRGVLWTAPHRFPGGKTLLIRDEYGSVDEVQIDPDSTSPNDALWMARECVDPVWQLERDWQRPEGSIKANLESADSQSRRIGDSDKDLDRARGDANDLVRYWKIYSKMGCGAKLSGIESELGTALDEMVGDNCYLVIVPGMPYPLNLPPDKLQEMTDEEVSQAASWPIPFWGDERWPCTFLDFYSHPTRPWPIGPLVPGLGELKFINIMVSHLANRIWTSSRDFWAVAEDAAADLEDQIVSGKDQVILKYKRSQSQGIQDLAHVITQPQTNADVWTILEAVMEIFDKRVGLSELHYAASGKQMRSAQEASLKGNSMNVRPDHMANKVEEFLTEVSRKEAFCARWFLEARDIAPALGPAAAQLWQQHVAETDVEKVVRELEYRVEESSARKPNRDRDTANINQALPMLMPLAQQYFQMTGNPGPINNLIDQWGKASDSDMSGMMLQPLQPPQQPPPEPEGEPNQ